MNIFNFSIPRLTPTNNVLLRLHWRARQRLNGDWIELVKVATQDLEIPRPAYGEHRWVTIISRRLQLADPDNHPGGLKPLLDALKNADLIFDDGPKYLTLRILQVLVHKRAEQETIIFLKVDGPRAALPDKEKP